MAESLENRLYFSINGSTYFESQFFKEDNPEIKQRASVIISCQLFCDKPKYKVLRPHIATILFKGAFSDTSTCRSKEIKCRCYVPDNPDYIVNVIKVKEDEQLEVKGTLELQVHEKYFVRIKYDFNVFCTRNKISYAELQSEPHILWVDWIRLADESIAKGNCRFSLYSIDRAITDHVEKNPMVYLQNLKPGQ